MKRRGISPVIAVLLLIVIAVAAAVVTYIWLTGYIGGLQPQAEYEQLEERIKIEAVSYDSSAQTVTVYFRNIGDVSTTVSSAFVLNADSGTAVCSNTNVGSSLDPGAGDSTDITSCTLSSGTTYIVKIVTQNGVEATYRFTYRS